MKRKSLLLMMLLALFAPLAMNGQTSLLTENFDVMSSISTDYSATGWYAYNAGSGNNWDLNTGSSWAYSGNNSAKYKYHSSQPANCYLVSAPFSVSSNMAELSVSLYERVHGSSYNETFEVFFVKASDVTSVASVSSATRYSAIASASYSNTTFAQKTGTVTNSALKGQSVRVVVHCTSAANQWFLYIDDIVVTETTSGGGGSSYITEIASVANWEAFCTAVNGGHDYSGQTVTMTANVTDAVTTMAGTSSNHPFRGTFDGGGHTLNVNINNATAGSAPFQYIDGARIQNLKVTGSVNSYHHSSGLVGFCDGEVFITNCLVSTNVTVKSNAGFGLCGGIIGHGQSATTHIIGCVYNGTIDIKRSDNARGVGGLYGWGDSPTIYLENSIFAGTRTTSGNTSFHPFGCFNGDDSNNGVTGSITNCYYIKDNINIDILPDNNKYAITNSNHGLNTTSKHAYTITGSSTNSVTVANAGSTTIYEYSGITSYGTGIKYNNVLYAGQSDEVSLKLGCTIPSGHTLNGYTADNGTLSGTAHTGSNDAYTLTMPNSNTVISANITQMKTHIANDETATHMTWDQFAAKVNGGQDYSGVTIYLDEDITVSGNTMAGSMNGEHSFGNAFSGTFDGQGHTITVSYNQTESGSNLYKYTAPFPYINNAMIQNLTVSGSITNAATGSAGLVGYGQGTNYITNCVSTVTITGVDYGCNGGFMANNNKGTTVYFEGCAFTGTLGSGLCCGGFIGWSEDGQYQTKSYAHFTNCVVNPQINGTLASDSKTFTRTRAGQYLYFTNCYYVTAINSDSSQGKQAYSITGGTGVTVTMNGTATPYDESGITVYASNSGMLYNSGIIAGNGETVSLTLGGSITGNYEADHGTLTGSGSSYTLQMANYDTNIFIPITVSVSANPSNGGTVNGGGQYANGASATVSAIPTGTYCFVNWTENGTVVSTDLNYTFPVTEDRTLVANFVSFDANITVSGNTTIACGSTTTLTASGLNGVAYNWYSDEACTQLVQENSATLTTPALTENTTYYVKAVGGTSLVEQETTFSYTGSAQTYDVPENATSLKMEVWGAQGGYRSSSTYGGKGGYSIGTLSDLNGVQNLYVYVGGSGNTGGTSGGYNGGGSRDTHNGGGGATHIATRSGLLSSLSSYQSDVLVVAGGGGSDGATTKYGMYGGGETGGSATQSYGSGGGGGTQTAGGAGGNNNSGSFGQGGKGISRSDGYGGAGGGGWYGGGGSYPDGSGDDDRGGGGGSGHVNAILTDARTIAGDASMPNPNGGEMTGREGDGYARITAYINDACESEAKAVTITVNQPAAPTNVTASNVSLTTATVNWDANGESSWQYSIDNGANWTNASTNTVNLSDLTPGQTYTFQVKAVGSGTCESMPASVQFTTLSTYNVTVTANPAVGGTVSINNGTPGTNVTEACNANSNVTLTATANSGYTFGGWYENSSLVSPNATYSFTVTGNTTLTAYFGADQTLTTYANPIEGGYVTIAENQVSTLGAVTVGNGTTGNVTGPYMTQTQYSFQESVYTAAELGNTARTITSISYNITALGNSANDHIEVYMKNVSRSTFANNSNYEPVTANDKVYDGYLGRPASISGSANDNWITIILDKPFQYNGTDNLMIGIHENTPGNSGRSYMYTTTSGYTTIACFNNSEDLDPTASNTFNYRGKDRANVRLGFGTYHYGQSVTLTAHANDGYQFVNWTENSYEVGTHGDATYTVAMDGNHTIYANFERLPKRFVTAGNWNVDNNWSPTGAPDITDDVFIEAAAIIPANCTAEANTVTINGGSITIADGGQLQHNNTGVRLTAQKEITGYTENNAQTNKGYYLISSPVDGIAASDVTGLQTSHYDLYKFVSNNEANGNLLEWVHVNGSLVRNEGYIYASRTDTRIEISGTVLPSNNTISKTLTYNEGYRFGGWNLIGNPFVCNAYVNVANYYILNDESGYNEFVATDNSHAIAPMSGLMVVATTTGQSVTYSRTAAPSEGSGILNIDVNRTMDRGTTMLDRARVRFGEGEGLQKFQFNPNHTKVYIPQDGSDYAVVYADGAGTIPVNFKAQDNGRYTLDFSTEEVSFNYLHLIDNMNGNDVDLLQTPYYAFDAKSTDFASRFTLVFATGSSTGSETGNFAFFNNGVWIINNPSTGSGAEATLQVVDVLGHILSSETISGSCSKAINVAPGVYMLRLINGNDVKVQKIVVR